MSEQLGWAVVTFGSADPDFCDLERCPAEAIWCETYAEAALVAQQRPDWSSPHIILARKGATTVFHPAGKR